MSKARSFLQIVVCFLVVSAVILTQSAQGQVVKAFSISGEGVGPDGLPLPGQAPRMHWINGTATHLGRHYGEGTVRTDTATVNPDGTITGEFGSGDPFVFTGANGDQLVCYYGRTDQGASSPGTFTLTIVDVLPSGDLVVEAEWIAEFVAVSDQCTGRFEGVTGSWVMYAYSEPFVLGSNNPVFYRWEGTGRLRFQKR